MRLCKQGIQSDNQSSVAKYESPPNKQINNQLNFDTESDDEELNQIPMKSAKEMLGENDESNSDSDGEEKQLLADKTPEFQMNHDVEGGWKLEESKAEQKKWNIGQYSDSDVS